MTSAERKGVKGKKPGIIVATRASFEQKQKLMKAKPQLKSCQKYRKVFIENDYSQEIRTCDSNFRTILKEMGKDKQFRVAGGKVYPVKSKAESDCVRLGCWNVGGWSLKDGDNFKDGDKFTFRNCGVQYLNCDIFCIAETFLRGYESLLIPGYTFYGHNRTNFAY